MIGRPRVHHRRVDSTNQRARELAESGAPHGTLVTADEQTAGRGRQGRAWIAPPGGAVLMSILLRRYGETLPLAAAVAVCEALPVPAGIKWPNDVWVEGRKVAGILVEGRPLEEWAVVGVGVNVSAFPPELAGDATSLHHAGFNGGNEEVLGSLVASFERWLARPAPDVLAAWRSHDALLGADVRWTAGRGRAAGINEAGALLVDTDAGRVALDAGEIHLLPG